uniref:Phospholipase A2-like central domain-containing protein n=1 Tax=Acanthochromis polyacanthus TaxID=80966 RepID=A0A3Q1GTS0_9TELE
MSVQGLQFLLICVVNGALLPKALWQFGNMISCFQPGVKGSIISWSSYLKWKKCCKVHDNCYEESRKTPGCMAIADLPYVISYDYICSSNKVTCSGRMYKLAVGAHTAECLAQNKYNPEFKYLDI